MAARDKKRVLARLVKYERKGYTPEFEEAVEELAEFRGQDVEDALLASLRLHLSMQETGTLGLLGSALARVGSTAAIEPLIACMANLEEWERSEIEQALVQFGAPAVAPLIAALSHANSRIRDGAMAALQELGAVAIDPLLEALSNGSAPVRSHAAEVLGAIGDGKALRPLIAALHDDDAQLQAKAAAALGKLRDVGAVEPLLDFGEHPSDTVRTAVAASLGELRAAAASEYLVSRIFDEGQRVWKSAQRSLVKLGPASINPLTEHLHASTARVRKRAAIALTSIGGTALHSVFAALDDENPEVRASAAAALGTFKLRNPVDYTQPANAEDLSHQHVVRELLRALSDRDARVRKAACRSLGTVYSEVQFLINRGDLNVTHIVEALATVAQRPDDPAQKSAIESLLKISGDSKLLARLLTHEDPSVRRATLEGLQRYFSRLNSENDFFPVWFDVVKDFYHVVVGESAKYLLGVLTDSIGGNDRRTQLDAIEVLRLIRTKLQEKRLTGRLDRLYSWRGPMPESQLDQELQEEKSIHRAIAGPMVVQAPGLAYHVRDTEKAEELDRFTDLTLYEGHLYRGDDLSRETQLDDALPLVAGQPYTLEVAVRRQRTGIDADVEAPPIGNPRQDNETLTLFLLAESRCTGITIKESFTKVKWPHDQDSESAFFRLDIASTLQQSCSGIIEVRIYDRALDLLDVVHLSVTAVPDEFVMSGSELKPRTLTWPGRLPGQVKFDPNAQPRALSIDVSFDATKQTYALLFKFLRKDAKRPVAIPGRSSMTTADVEGLLASLRDFWTDLVITNYQDSLAVTGSTFAKYLKNLRSLGIRAWTLLFGTGYAAQEGSSETIAQLLMAMNIAENTRIQINGAGCNFVFPWSVLHPPEDETTPVDPFNFWGARYVIEQVTDGPKNDALCDEPVNVLFVLDQAFGNAADQAKLLKDYEDAAARKLTVTAPVSNRATLFEELERKPATHLLYCFCHGYAPGEGNVLKRDGVRLLKEQIEKLEENSASRQALETLLMLTGQMGNESWMYIGGAQVRESELSRQKFFEVRRPIVFLNMCQSAELVPSMSSGLVRLFLKRNASAVVGTECPMTAVFANAFAQKVFDSLFGGDDIGSALWKARRHFLQQRNPLGLAYTLYGRAVAKLGAGPVLRSLADSPNIR